MPLCRKSLDLHADPLAVARALADRPGLSLLWSARGGGPSYVASDPIDEVSALDPEPSLELDPALGAAGRAPRWIGVLPYEACRSLERPRWTRSSDPRPAPHVDRPLWRRYAAVAKIAGDSVELVGDDAGAVRGLARRVRAGLASARPAPAKLELVRVESAARHAARIKQALSLIAQGDLYQVNLARRFELAATGHPVNVLETLSRRAAAPYAAALCLGAVDVVSTSPELFLALEPDRRVLTAPIKGTRPRGGSAAEDAALCRELDADPKERAELAMILDVERNDLGRVARTGSVKLLEPPHVDTHPSVHHRVALLGAVLGQGLGRRELLAAMLPSGSVTGAPKVRAMEVIFGLEPHRRGLYTGAFGALRQDGGLSLGMAIRTLTLADGRGHYFAGGGIVADSDPAREVEETLWKALQITGPSGPAGLPSASGSPPQPSRNWAVSPGSASERDWTYGS